MKIQNAEFSIKNQNIVADESTKKWLVSNGYASRHINYGKAGKVTKFYRLNNRGKNATA